MDRTEAMIFQNLYWIDIRDDVWKEVSNGDTLQRTKGSNTKYVKLPAKLTEEIPWNKLCVDIIGPYEIQYNGKIENLHLKSVTMIDPVTRWFEVVRFND